MTTFMVLMHLLLVDVERSDLDIYALGRRCVHGVPIVSVLTDSLIRPDEISEHDGALTYLQCDRGRIHRSAHVQDLQHGACI